MKRIVICCDGTWNRPDQGRGGMVLPTNVAQLATGVADRDAEGVRQLTYYGIGLGAEGGWVRRLFSGATGWGLSANLKDAYRFVIRHYEPGDELYLFGFSRGAFTVRSLAGLINNSGILRPEHADRVDQAFDQYRSRSRSAHPRRSECVLFRKTYACGDRTPIRFIGVWDTVGALGNPLLLMKSPLSRRFHFHDTELSSTVEHAYHAMAIDEQRRHFKATRWQQQDDSPNQVLEQRWFVGVHSDVGGGTPYTGLSDLALSWLLDKAADCGLALHDAPLSPDVMQGPAQSRRGFYRLVPRYHRPINGSPDEKTRETLDESARHRVEDDESYRPPSLMAYLDRSGDKN